MARAKYEHEDTNHAPLLIQARIHDAKRAFSGRTFRLQLKCVGEVKQLRHLNWQSSH